MVARSLFGPENALLKEWRAHGKGKGIPGKKQEPGLFKAQGGGR